MQNRNVNVSFLVQLRRTYYAPNEIPIEFPIVEVLASRHGKLYSSDVT